MSLYQMQEDADFDNAKVNLLLVIWCIMMFFMSLSFQLHPKDRSSIPHDCFYCGASAKSKPALLV